MKQNGNAASYGSVPTRIDQVGYTPEAYARKKNFRTRLFFTLGILSTLSFVAIFCWMAFGHAGSPPTVSLATLDGITDADAVSTGCETTVMIVRHCEKNGNEIFDSNGDQHCSYIGFERASYFATLFGKGGWPIPSFLYAMTKKRNNHHNYREIEMVTPLRQKYDLDLQSDYHSNSKLATEIKQVIASGEACGKLILVAWKHEQIGDLARDLGCQECPIDYPNVFDMVWHLKYVYKVSETELYQHIDNDAKTQQHRYLKKKKMTGWSLYFSSMAQNFDPLKYSNTVGDYEGNKVADNWVDDFNKEM
jgi:hypothetical protein